MQTMSKILVVLSQPHIVNKKLHILRTCSYVIRKGDEHVIIWLMMIDITNTYCLVVDLW